LVKISSHPVRRFLGTFTLDADGKIASKIVKSKEPTDCFSLEAKASGYFQPKRPLGIWYLLNFEGSALP
jgi:hypothetical protein